MPPNTNHEQIRSDLKAVYCGNRRCTNGYPVGKARLTPGSEVSFSCKVCGHRTVKAG